MAARSLSVTRLLHSAPAATPFRAVETYRSSLVNLPTHVHAPLINLSDPSSSTGTVVPLPSSIFLHSCHPSLFHQLVRQHLAGLRAGNASTKSRAEVNYSGRKLRPQKGSGKARLGDRGSPMLRGGGRAFAKKPKDWSFHVNRKMVHKGLMASLALRWVMGQLHIVDSETLPLWSKTRDAVSALEASPLGWTAERGTLLYLGQPTLQSSKGRALQLSTRNLPNVQVVDTLSSDTFNVYELLRPSRIAMDVEALNEVVHMLAPTVQDDLPFQLDELLLTEEANRKNQERETMTGGTELGQMTHEPSVLAQA